VKLLKSDVAIPAEARQHLADLFERYQLGLKPGGKGGRITPSYDLPHHIVQLDAAVWLVRRQLKAGTPRDDAVKYAIASCGVDEEALHAHLAGKHTSARQAKKRRPLVRNLPPA
jgi:hypothetical protein